MVNCGRLGLGQLEQERFGGWELNCAGKRMHDICEDTQHPFVDVLIYMILEFWIATLLK